MLGKRNILVLLYIISTLICKLCQVNQKENLHVGCHFSAKTPIYFLSTKLQQLHRNEIPQLSSYSNNFIKIV